MIPERIDRTSFRSERFVWWCYGEQKIEPQSLESTVEMREFFMEPPEENRTGILADLPFDPPHHAVYWTWYVWQLHHSFDAISKRLRSITKLVATPEAAKEESRRSMLGYYEWFVIQGAVLTGDETSMRLASEVVAGSAGRPGQFYNSLAAMIKARTDADQKMAEKQLAMSDREDGVHPTPSRALLKAFAEWERNLEEEEVPAGRCDALSADAGVAGRQVAEWPYVRLRGPATRRLRARQDTAEVEDVEEEVDVGIATLDAIEGGV